MSVLAPVVERPRLRGALHLAAAVIAVPAGGYLVARAPAGAARVATVVYVTVMTGMFSVSAAYHRGRWTPGARRRVKALDHVMIFAFIGGSYGPLAVSALPPSTAMVWLGTLWVGVVAGCVVKLRRLDLLGGPADVWYGVLTWWSVLVLPPLAGRLSGGELALLFGGLAIYSIAAAALGSRRPDPRPATFGYHEVAHAVMLLGTTCHYLLYLRLFG